MNVKSPIDAVVYIFQILGKNTIISKLITFFLYKKSGHISQVRYYIVLPYFVLKIEVECKHDQHRLCMFIKSTVSVIFNLLKKTLKLSFIIQNKIFP